jgi:hypothetical protein
MARPRNAALLVAPGTRARLELSRGVAADVVRGAAPGPVVWLWAARGPGDPSLQLALAELRDAIEPATLHGALGLLLDGPPVTHGALAAQLARESSGVILLHGGARGETTLTYAAADLREPRSRRLAEALGFPFVTTAARQPALDRALLAAPLAWLVAGSLDRLERSVVDRVRTSLLDALSALGLQGRVGLARVQRPARLRTLVALEPSSPGLLEPLVAPGTEVTRGQLVARHGDTHERQLLHAPAAGVVLSVRAGWIAGGAALVIGRRTLKDAIPAPAEADVEAQEVGWCELVDLPELGVRALPAKIDTGARTSALHVVSATQLPRERGRSAWEVEVPDGDGGTVRARVELVGHSVVRDSGGHAERRPVIETLLVLGRRARRVRLSLTDRGDMRFPMLVGRTAFDEGTRIDPTRSFILRPDRRRRSRS